jgi:hypothetical protein
MFQFPGFALNPYGFRVQSLHLTPRSANARSLLRSQYKGSKVGFPIRRFLDQSSFAAPQDLSQRTTSFIASQRQGIHQMLLRHLITLMINVRSAKTEQRSQERPVLRIAPQDIFCLPSISGAPGCGPGLVRGTRLSACRICCLFTISNIRAPHPNRGGHEPHLTFRIKTMVEPVGIEPTT